MSGLLTGRPLVIRRGLELAVEYRPGRGSIKLGRSHLSRAGPCVSTTSCGPGLHCGELGLNVPPRGF